MEWSRCHREQSGPLCMFVDWREKKNVQAHAEQGNSSSETYHEFRKNAMNENKEWLHRMDRSALEWKISGKPLTISLWSPFHPPFVLSPTIWFSNWTQRFTESSRRLIDSPQRRVVLSISFARKTCRPSHSPAARRVIIFPVKHNQSPPSSLSPREPQSILAGWGDGSSREAAGRGAQPNTVEPGGGRGWEDGRCSESRCRREPNIHWVTRCTCCTKDCIIISLKKKIAPDQLFHWEKKKQHLCHQSSFVYIGYYNTNL